MRVRTCGLVAAASIALCVGGAALAQAQGIKRNILQRSDVAGTEAKEAVLATAEIEPGAAVGKHLHAGFEIAYIVQGELDLIVEGEPVRHLKAGDSYQIAARKPHDGKNTGTTPAKVVVTYVVEKGQPLATPVK